MEEGGMRLSQSPGLGVQHCAVRPTGDVAWGVRPEAVHNTVGQDTQQWPG